MSASGMLSTNGREEVSSLPPLRTPTSVLAEGDRGRTPVPAVRREPDPFDTETTPRGFPSTGTARAQGLPRYEVLLWLAGEIEDVDMARGEFHALLRDEKGQASKATIGMNKVVEADRPYVVPGARFTFHAYLEEQPDAIRTVEEIVMEPVRRWAEADEAEFRSLTQERYRFLDDA